MTAAPSPAEQRALADIMGELPPVSTETSIALDLIRQPITWRVSTHRRQVRLLAEAMTVSKPGDVGVSFSLSPEDAIRLGRLIYHAGKRLSQAVAQADKVPA